MFVDPSIQCLRNRFNLKNGIQKANLSQSTGRRILEFSSSGWWRVVQGYSKPEVRIKIGSQYQGHCSALA